MENPLKKFLSLFFKSSASVTTEEEEESTDKDILVVGKDSSLYRMVEKKMTEANEDISQAKKLQDLEKAVYVLSGRINQLTEAIQKHTEFIVHLSTAYEEVANSFENEHRESSSPQKKAGEDLDVYIAGKNKGKTELN